MFVDLMVLALVVLITWLGYRKGFLRQIVGFVALIAVYFFATPGATLVRLVVFSSEGITFPGIEVASLIIAGVIIFVGVWLVGRLFTGALTTVSERVEGVDMALGGALGFVKAVLLVYIALCIMVYAESPLSNASPELGEHMTNSYAMEGARQFNVLTMFHYTELDELRGAIVAGQDPEKAERNEALGRLMQNEDFQAVVADEKLVAAAKDRDYSTLLSDERVLKLLADEDFRKVLTETDWDDLADK